MLTIDKFTSWFPGNKFAQQWVEAINKVTPDYGLTTPTRLAAFLAECSVESMDFTELQENLNYSAEGLCKTFPSHFSGLDEATAYAHNPEKIANRVYSNRMGNGDESSGDGWLYRGQGVIQLTGKQNQQAFADSINMIIGDIPNFLGTFEGAIQSACFFWEDRNLNELADLGDIDQISKKINGGDNGIDVRRQKYQIIKNTIG
jgi:putative chitinase